MKLNDVCLFVSTILHSKYITMASMKLANSAFMTKLGRFFQNFGIVQPRYHQLICGMSILPSFIKISIEAQSNNLNMLYTI